MDDSRPIVQSEISLLILIYKKYKNHNAINKLWELYFPMIMGNITHAVSSNIIDIKDYTMDLVDDAYIFFVDGVTKYSKKRQKSDFNKYIEDYIKEKISEKVIELNKDFVTF